MWLFGSFNGSTTDGFHYFSPLPSAVGDTDRLLPPREHEFAWGEIPLPAACRVDEFKPTTPVVLLSGEFKEIRCGCFVVSDEFSTVPVDFSYELLLSNQNHRLRRNDPALDPARYIKARLR